MIFLVPRTLMIDNFWKVMDAAVAQIQQIRFVEILYMLIATLLIHILRIGASGLG